jgi:hypothetical protein
VSSAESTPQQQSHYQEMLKLRNALKTIKCHNQQDIVERAQAGEWHLQERT